MSEHVERYKELALRYLDVEVKRTQADEAKKNAEEAKVTFRNARRDGNKHADGLKGSGIPEDELETLKKEIQDLLKKFETDSDALVTAKQKEIETL